MRRNQRLLRRPRVRTAHNISAAFKYHLIYQTFLRQLTLPVKL